MISSDTYTGPVYGAKDPRIAGQPTVFSKENDDAAAASFARVLANTASVSTSPAANSAAAASVSSVQGTEESGFLSFIKAVVDVINPLQHIPVVGAIYRHMTGDEISAPARVAGDALFGGPIGAALGMADVAFQNITGKDAGETMMALLTDPEDKTAPVQLAAKEMPDDIIWLTPPENTDTPAALPHARVADASFFKDSPPNRTHVLQTEDGIVWETPEPGAHSRPTNETPVPIMKGADNASPAGVTASGGMADFTSVPLSQDAPAAGPRKGPPPELIASKMMEALDKYTAMKRQQTMAAAPSTAVSF